MKDDTENKDIDDDCETVEKKENELLLGRKNTPKQKEKKIKKQEDSDKDSDEEEEKKQERYIILMFVLQKHLSGVRQRFAPA